MGGRLPGVIAPKRWTATRPGDGVTGARSGIRLLRYGCGW
jgi:hypothetical protein